MARYIEIKDTSYDLVINEDEIVSLIIASDRLNLNYQISNANAKILVFNNASELILNEKGFIDHSTAEINYIDLSHGSLKQNSNVTISSDSELNVNTTYLGVNAKDIEITLTNEGCNSHSFIRNNVVALQDARFKMDIIGHIGKEARSSSAHQKSNCLTVEEPKQAKISPILLIDNNDVEASHSLASGALDQEVMFYINSRGLSKHDALSLLLNSYLLKDDAFYSSYPNGDQLKQLSLRKVEDYVRR